MAKPATDPGENRFLLEHTPFWRDFVDQVKEIFSKPPDVQIESKPIPVQDIWSKPKSLRSRAGVFLAHALVIGVMMLPFWRPVRMQLQKVAAIPIFTPPPPPPQVMPKIHLLSGGGAPVHQIMPRMISAKAEPFTAPTTMAPLSEVESSSFNGDLGALGSAPGSGGGNGGNLGGMGGGGDCVGANCGGGVGITQPVPIYQPDPEYSDAARKAKFQGTCVVQVVVGADGRVSDPHVMQPLGLGLDQKAIEAVLQWRFRPARDASGKPVAVTANIEVNFRLF